MPAILCPCCGQPLTRREMQLSCPRGHSFDVARQGYVNLLTVEQKHSRHPGDTREMVAARRAFLCGGYYDPIAREVCRLAGQYAPEAQFLLDVGCGEGYYSARVAQALGCGLFGLDISKDAVRYAAGQHKNGTWLCATAAHLPFGPGEFDLVMSMFALTLPREFGRVLTDGGIFLQVLAAEDHLMGLKGIIYPEIIRKEKDSVPHLPGFRLLESRALAFPITLEGPQVQNLLAMTPHLWRIPKAGAQALANTHRLEDRASVVINVYRKETAYGSGD